MAAYKSDVGPDGYPRRPKTYGAAASGPQQPRPNTYPYRRTYPDGYRPDYYQDSAPANPALEQAVTVLKKDVQDLRSIAVPTPALPTTKPPVWLSGQVRDLPDGMRLKVVRGPKESK